MQHIFSAQPLYCQDMGRPALKPQPAYGAHLAKLRETVGLTQKQLAEKMGVPISDITFWERGNKPPRSEVLATMAEALGVTVDVILGVEAPKIKCPVAKGRLQQVFEAASRLPRRQQQKVVEFLEPFVKEHANGQKQAA